jgi:hypothetical protein
MRILSACVWLLCLLTAALVLPGAQRVSAALERHPTEPARAVAAVMARKEVKAFFAVIIRTSEPRARLDAFAQAVASLDAAEVGHVIALLRDRTVPASTWEEALAPLADVVPAEERTAMVRALQDPAVRAEVLRALEQVHLFKTAQAQEARERHGR